MTNHPVNADNLFICQECGQAFVALTNHLKRHHLKTEEYLVKHHLHPFTRLISLEKVEQLRENGRQSIIKAKGLNLKSI